MDNLVLSIMATMVFGLMYVYFMFFVRSFVVSTTQTLLIYSFVSSLTQFSIPSNVNFAGFSGAEDNTILAYAQDGSAYINIYGFWYPVSIQKRMSSIIIYFV